jgi:membrane carboxypeptidase/penicillin-binding protein PbpC
VGDWVGNFDRREMRGSAGAETAAPLFRDVLLAAQQRLAGRLPDPADPLRAAPAGLSEARICALSGLAATALCPRVARERLADPGPACDWHVPLDGGGARVVSMGGPARGVQVVWPSQYRAWAAERGLLGRDAAPAGPATGPLLRIANPPAGAVYFYDPTLRAAFQTLPLRAERRGAPSELEWRVDGRLVGRTRSDAAVDWPLSRGPHTIEVRDASGAAAATRIAVR